MEKKKRFRPTVTAYRALEEELKITKQQLSNHMASNSRYMEDIAKFTSKVSTLEHSNRLLKEELDRVREANKELSKTNKQLCDELQVIKSRGFLARVFNL